MGDLAGEARRQPEPCTERYWSKLLHVQGTTVAVSATSPTYAVAKSDVEPRRIGAGFEVLEWWLWPSSLLVELTSATHH